MQTAKILKFNIQKYLHYAVLKKKLSITLFPQHNYSVTCKETEHKMPLIRETTFQSY